MHQRSLGNQLNSLQNSVQPQVIDEIIKEYSVMIDSKDRDYRVFPDPFCYDVTFGPLPATRNYQEGLIFQDSPSPTISESFKDVRYIKLQEIILPLYTLVRQEKEYDEDGEFIMKWKVNVDKPLTNNPYVVLFIGDQYSDVNYRSTNDVLASGFATVYHDSNANLTHYFGFTSNGQREYTADALARINKFKIRFTDPYGDQIMCPHVDKTIESGMICTCYDPEGDENTTCFRHNLFHPLNPIFQNHLHFKIGVSQTRIRTQRFY
jgi:hypothetical protein